MLINTALLAAAIVVAMGAWYFSRVSRRRMETSLRHTENRFALFTQRLPGLAWIKDSSGRYVYVNDAAEIAFGRPRLELHGRTDDELFPAETAARFRENDIAALSSATGIFVEETLQHEDGTVHQSLVSKFPIPIGDSGEVMVGGMAIDITERRQAEEALRLADRRKDEFIATLSHELRNPLAPLSNGLQLLRLRGTDPERAADIHAMMDRQINQLARLIDDLLDVARISTGRIQLRSGVTNLEGIVNDAVEAARPHLDAMSQKLSLTLPDDPILIDADPARLAQAILNLLNNASKFTDRGGEISLRAVASGGRLSIYVRDNGIGIPRDKLAHIFEMFYQVDRSLERTQNGMGVGLSLVRAIVEMHGGTVECESEGHGKGSEFVIHLPLSQVGVAQGRPRRDSEAAQAGRRANLRLLVVDDNRDAAESFSLILEDMGNTVRTAYDGAAAIHEAIALRPHAVMLDIGLPGMSGYEVASRMRELPELKDTVLIAVTGWGESEDRRRTSEVGFAHHVVKPVSLATLVELIASLESND